MFGCNLLVNYIFVKNNNRVVFGIIFLSVVVVIVIVVFFFKKKIIVHCKDTICDLINLTMDFNISYTKINKRCVK
jgi:hypothetical protein